ncbi:septum formation protein [Silvibacterium bohemicum]|uniref:dTTP/UTP pyrophosphatase n=1 Tax=Silvibacterium bohemicum TaxID=1577686 RepID=A0A841K042_9BACT|nr:Maf family protein [Silvibacterium bohemicum]MBB6145977.1 septum formation protein [Silvibacterium bohemicum]
MLVLASASPRRRELLALGGFTFTVAPAAIPEELGAGESAIGYVTRLAREKAEAVWARHSPQDGEGDALLVLGADTTVVAPDGQILEKPADAADAARMLRQLSGTTHQVITGVALVSATGVEVAAEVTYVSMLTLSDEEIAAYVAAGESMDKAGAYGIQGRAARWIPRVHGCYFNVMGLPLALVSTMIEGAVARHAKPKGVAASV